MDDDLQLRGCLRVSFTHPLLVPDFHDPMINADRDFVVDAIVRRPEFNDVDALISVKKALDLLANIVGERLKYDIRIPVLIE
jgi:hypothetical protein